MQTFNLDIIVKPSHKPQVTTSRESCVLVIKNF